MQVAISTDTLSLNTPEALERAQALGFTHVEVNLQSAEFGYAFRRRPNVRFYRTLKKQLTQLGLSVWSVTLPTFEQAVAFSPRARKEILLNAAGAAGILDAKVYVAEPAQLFTDEDALTTYLTEKKAPPTVMGFDETWAQVVNRRMTFAVTNSEYYIGNPLTNQVDRLKKVTTDLAIGAALDVRAAAQRNGLDNWVEEVGERVAVAHLYDVSAETLCAPISDEWGDLLAPFARTRLKCVVLRGDRQQSDDDLIASRNHIDQLVQFGR